MNGYDHMMSFIAPHIREMERPASPPEPEVSPDFDTYDEPYQTDEERDFDARLVRVMNALDSLQAHLAGVLTNGAKPTDTNVSKVTCMELLVPRLDQMAAGIK